MCQIFANAVHLNCSPELTGYHIMMEFFYGKQLITYIFDSGHDADGDDDDDENLHLSIWCMGAVGDSGKW